MEQKIIFEKVSNYCSPCFLVKKKEEGKYRLVIDYRELNRRIKYFEYPIPSIKSIMDRLASHKYYAALDLTKSFHQLQLSPESRYLTAFTDGKKNIPV